MYVLVSISAQAAITRLRALAHGCVPKSSNGGGSLAKVRSYSRVATRAAESPGQHSGGLRHLYMIKYSVMCTVMPSMIDCIESIEMNLSENATDMS